MGKKAREHEVVPVEPVITIPAEKSQFTQDSRNANRGTKKGKKAIKESLTQLGAGRSAVADKNGVLIAGNKTVENWNGAIQVVQTRGDVLVIVQRMDMDLESADDTSARRLAHYDNQTSFLDFDLDMGVLASDIQGGIDLGSLYTEKDIEKILATIANQNIDPTIDKSDVDAQLADDSNYPKKMMTKYGTAAGQLWQLGQHRLCIGDCLNIASYRTLFQQGEKAQMVFTDPPYNVKVEDLGAGSTYSSITRKNETPTNSIKDHGEFAMASGEMSESEFTSFLANALRLMSNFSADGSIHYICMDWRHMLEILTAGKSVYTEFKQMCVWAKDNAGMGTFYRSQHELIFIFKNGKAPHINNFQLGQTGRYRSNLWKYDGLTSFSTRARNGNVAGESEFGKWHPTVKPLEMVVDAIRDCSHEGGIVLDPFVGSGTTLLASHDTKRVFRGMEITAHYAAVAIERWCQNSGEAPQLL